MNVQHKDDKFFVVIEGNEAYLLYNVDGNEMDIYHTFTPPELRGRGIAEQLALAAFDYARKNNLKVIPSCSYIKDTFLKRHAEFNDIVLNA